MKYKRAVFLEKGHLDMAPLIDIVFLLLIFFMLTSSFIFQPGIRVDLPKAVTSEVLHKGLLVVIVDEKNRIYINEKNVGKDEMVNIIVDAAQGEQSLLIKADKNADLGTIIEVWDVCRQADVNQINIATTQ
jgi:biopolymer transport protein ExbD